MHSQLLGDEHLLSGWNRAIRATQYTATQHQRATERSQTSSLQTLGPLDIGSSQILEISLFMGPHDASFADLLRHQPVYCCSGKSGHTVPSYKCRILIKLSSKVFLSLIVFLVSRRFVPFGITGHPVPHKFCLRGWQW